MVKIVFMGTPDFAVPSLRELVRAGHEVGMVVTKPDVKRDRGKKVKYSQVKEEALALSLSVEQPDSIKDNLEFIGKLKDYGPDYIVTAAYGKILPKEVLDIPKKAALNVHGSLLPKYRGAAPIQWSILNGDEKTGVTIMYMAEGMDTGDMLAKVSTDIDNKNCEDLHDELSQKGAKLLVGTIDKLERGEIVPEKQNESQASYAPMITKKDGELDFMQDAASLERKIRAFYPWPGAFTKYRKELLKIWEGEVVNNTAYKDVAPGTIVKLSDEGMDIVCGSDLLRVKVIQISGKKKMKMADFLRGHKIEKSIILG